MVKKDYIFYFLWFICLFIVILSVACLAVREYPRMAIVMGITAVVILFFFWREHKKKLNTRSLFALLVFIIVMQGVGFVRFSEIDYKRYIGPSSYITRYDYFEKRYTGAPMSFVEFRSFALTLGYDYFCDKEIYVDERLEGNPIVGYMLRGLNSELNLATIEVNEEQLLMEDNAFMSFSTSNNSDEALGLYLIKNDGEDNRVYISEGNSSIYIIQGIGNITCVEKNKVDNWISEDTVTDYTLVDTRWNEDILFGDNKKEETLGRNNVVCHNFITVSIIFVVGLLACTPLRNTIGNISAVFMALPFGTILLIIGNVILGTLGVAFTKWTVLGTWGTLALIVNVILLVTRRHEKRICEKEKYVKLIISIVVGFIIIAFFSIIPNVTVAYDALMYNYLSRYMVFNGEMVSNMGELSSFTFATPVINILATLVGVDLFYAFQPSHTMFGLIAIGALVHKLFGNKKGDIKSVVFVLVGILIYFTTPQFWAFTDWINNNILIAIWLGLAFAISLLISSDSEGIYAIALSLPFFVVGNIVRIEGMLYGSILLVMMYVCGYDKKLVKTYSVVSTLVLGAEFIWLYSILGNVDSEFWTPGKGAMVLVLLAGVTIALLLDNLLIKRIPQLYKYMDVIMIVALMLGAVALLALKPGHGISNAFAIGMQIFEQGYYGVLVLLVLYLLYFGRRRLRQNPMIYRCIVGYIIASILMTYDLCFFRSPLHYGASDSACRMIMQMLPILGIMISDIIMKSEITEN